jgi:hypothetical protein
MIKLRLVIEDKHAKAVKGIGPPIREGYIGLKKILEPTYK